MAEKKKIITPLLFLAAFIGCVVVLAVTDVFTPIVQYLHDFTITPLGAVVCFLAAVVMGYGVYKILVNLGKSLLPGDDE